MITCRTCKFLEYSPGGGPRDFEWECNNRTFASYESIMITKPDQFFCSDHETKDGTRFVNWEKLATFKK